jgi:hypothetical protein
MNEESPAFRRGSVNRGNVRLPSRSALDFTRFDQRLLGTVRNAV